MKKETEADKEIRHRIAQQLGKLAFESWDSHGFPPERFWEIVKEELIDNPTNNSG